MAPRAIVAVRNTKRTIEATIRTTNVNQDEPRRRSITSSAAGRLLLAIPLLGLLWPAVGWVLASDRGIDVTDEMLYLLDADPPSPTATWKFPYGWVTGGLLRVVGYDIAALRTAGGVLLLVASAVVAIEVHQLARTILEDNGSCSSREPQSIDLARYAAVAVAGLSGIIYYVGLPMLRTPSYNWVNLFGILLAVAGVIRTARIQIPAELRRRAELAALAPGAALAALGSFVAAHAKPTTPILLAITAYPLVRSSHQRATTLRFLGLTALAGGVIIALAFATTFWPTSALEVFLRGALVPSEADGQRLTTAVLLAAISPLELLWRAFRSDFHWLVSPLFLLAIASIVENRRGLRLLKRIAKSRSLRRSTPLLLIPALAMLATPATIVEQLHAGSFGPVSDLLMPGRASWPVHGYLVEWSGPLRAMGWLTASPLILALALDIRRERRMRWITAISAVVSVAALVGPPLSDLGPIIGFVALAAALVAHGQAESISGTPDRRRGAAIAFLLSCLPIYAFGHASGPVRAMSAGASLAALVVVLVILTGPLTGPQAHRGPALLALALIVLTIGLGLQRAWTSPYRLAPITEQTFPVALEERRATLRLEPALASYVNALRSAASTAGWTSGMPLYGLHVTWSSAPAFLLDAQPPPSIMPGLNFESGGLNRVRFDLERHDMTGWDRAWLVLPDPALGIEDGIKPERLAAVNRALELFTTTVGTEWPRDYEQVWTAPADAPHPPHLRITLWRPTS